MAESNTWGGRACHGRGRTVGYMNRSSKRLLVATALLVSATAPTAIAGQTTRVAGSAGQHFACSGPNSATQSCRFSTPSANVRCTWTPKPNHVACELLSTRRAYSLAPTGRAKRVALRLTRRGDTLPTNQNIVFPGDLSCHDTRTTMTCNQNFGTGAFKLAAKGSHGS